MRSVRIRSLSAGLLTVTMTAAVLGGSVGSTFAAPGSYDPNNVPYAAVKDANDITTLRIYDATTGALVKSGGNATALSSYYFSAEADFGQPDVGTGRKAALFGYLAKEGVAQGAWSGGGLGAAQTFPVPTGPAPVNGFTFPTTKGGSTNSFGQLASSFPNTAPSGDNFYQLYQIRIKTTFPTPQSTQYASADIKIDTTAGTWSLVRPVNPILTATTLGVSPASPATSGTVETLTATLNRSDAAGSVQFFDGTTALGSPVTVSSSAASTTVTLPPGTSSLTAVFTPTDATSYASSTSAPTSYSVVGPPSAPTGVTATPGDTVADVSWTAPSANGSPITSYDVTYTPSGGSPTTVNVPSGTSTQLTGLTNGTTYSITVTASNGYGTGQASAPVSVTPRTVPGAPTAPTATAGNGSASVAFTAPANDGGAPVTGYTVTSTPGNLTGTGSASPVTVSGLTNGTSYTFTVTATNAAGPGAASPASNAVTPAGAPNAPTGVTATNGDSTSDVSWTAPANDGGSAVTGYTVTATPTAGSTVTKSVTGTSTTLNGLVNGVTYSVTVTASNAFGTGAPSSAASATPFGVPNAPAKPAGTAGNGQVSVAFAAPANNGSPVTSYTVTASPGGATATGSSSPLVVTGLTNGTPYTFTVTATNARGTSAASPASDAVTPGVKTATTTTLAATPHDVYYGATIALRGTVTGVTGAQSVVVRAYYRSGAVDTTYSAPDGHLAVNLPARQNVTYRLIYLGDSAHSPSISAALRTTVHGRLAIGTLTRGIHKVTITGLIRPGVNGQSVTLYELRGGRLYGLKRVLTASNGRFTVAQAATSGRHVYRLIGAASPITGITNTVQVVVTIA